jgi:hypothetical protein
LAVLLIGAAAAIAGNSWNGYHWEDADGDAHDGDITITLVNDLIQFGSAYNGTIYNAVLSDWRNGGSGPLTLDSTSGSTRPDVCLNNGSAPILGEIHVCNSVYGQNGWLGLARIWLDAGGHIDAGVVLMNDWYMLGSEPLYNNDVARQHVLCQEIGHTFGLDHQASPKKQSCMNDRWGLNSTSFTGPNQHDFDTLMEIYGSASSDTGGGKSKPCNPKKPGCGHSAADIHVAARPGGGWIVTYTLPPGRTLP